jgi:hypothetical protein
MVTRTKLVLLLWCAATSSAYAQDVVDIDVDTYPGDYSYAWRDPRLPSEIGVGFTLGGGVGGFTDSDIEDVVSNDVGGTWGLRMSIGTHVPIGLDVSYTGTAQTLESFNLDDNPTLVGTNVEGALRWNILPHYTWNPYVFGGIGWQRYDVSNGDLSDQGLEDSTDLAVFPVGVGLGFRDRSGLTVDVRGTMRFAEDSNFIQLEPGNDTELHTWEAAGALGYEF